MASPPLALAKSRPPTSLVVPVTRSGPRRSPQSWSELPLDLMQLVFGRLGFADFERAKSVCSSWQSGSRKSKPNNQIPWLILFPKDKNHCLLLNPEDKEKLYKTQDLGNDFGKSSCLATYKSWLLMETKHEDFTYDLYILDLLTGKRIILPSYHLKCPILWIDEKTKSYLVIGMDGGDDAVCLKSGDNSWKIIYKMDSSEETNWKKIFSLGEESIILDLGITVLAKDHEGIISNSIYFGTNGFKGEYEENKSFIYNLNTKNFEKPQPFVSLSIPLSNACWFLPSFKRE